MSQTDQKPDASDRGNHPLLITIRAAADMLSLSPRTIWRLVAAGRLSPPLKIGGARRFRRADIERVAAEGCPPLSR